MASGSAVGAEASIASRGTPGYAAFADRRKASAHALSESVRGDVNDQPAVQEVEGIMETIIWHDGDGSERQVRHVGADLIGPVRRAIADEGHANMHTEMRSAEYRGGLHCAGAGGRGSHVGQSTPFIAFPAALVSAR